MIKKIIFNLYTLVLYRNVFLLKYMFLKSNLFFGNVRIEKSDIKKSEIYGDIVVKKNTFLRKAVIASKKMILNEGVRVYGAEIRGNDITIGKYTSLWGPNLFVFQKINPIKIGSFCSIARGVSFQEYNHNYEKTTSYYIGQNVFNEKWNNENVSNGSIEVGNDVWIGANAILLSGVKIGNGCVVAANSVLNKEYPPYSIIAGVPAKVIGYRFEEERIIELEKIKWWNWDIEKIKENKKMFE